MGWLTQLIGAGVQAGQDHKNAQQSEKVAEHNAQVSELQAQDTLNNASVMEQQYRRQIAKMIGTQRAVIGANNVEASGSALKLLEDSAQLGAEDITTIRNNASRQAWGYRNQASEASRIGGIQAGNQNAAALGSLLTGAANAYGTWKQQKG